MELPDFEAMGVHELLAFHSMLDTQVTEIRGVQRLVDTVIARKEREAERPGPEHLMQVTKPHA